MKTAVLPIDQGNLGNAVFLGRSEDSSINIVDIPARISTGKNADKAILNSYKSNTGGHRTAVGSARMNIKPVRVTSHPVKTECSGDITNASVGKNGDIVLSATCP